MAVKSKEEIKASVKNEVNSWFNKDTMDKIIKTLEYAIIPISTIAAIWGFDISTEVAAGMGVLISLCSFLKLFCKD